jgi:hypothetical protein
VNPDLSIVYIEPRAIFHANLGDVPDRLGLRLGSEHWLWIQHGLGSAQTRVIALGSRRRKTCNTVNNRTADPVESMGPQTDAVTRDVDTGWIPALPVL